MGTILALRWCSFRTDHISYPHHPPPMVEATWNRPAVLKASMQLWVLVPVARSGEQCLVSLKTFPGCTIACKADKAYFVTVDWSSILSRGVLLSTPSGVDWNRMPYPWIPLLEHLNDRDVGFFGFMALSIFILRPPIASPGVKSGLPGGCLQIAFWSPKMWRKTPGARGGWWYCQM